ncbi:MAG: class I SAM-dependent methyltransferase [Verrucomicrobiota bacterium]
MAAPYDSHRYRSSARYYAQGRLDYPPRLVRRVVELTGLTTAQRVLDLGCGPGFLAVSFAPYCREAVGMDPDESMLAEARKFAEEKGVRVTEVVEFEALIATRA